MAKKKPAVFSEAGGKLIARTVGGLLRGPRNLGGPELQELGAAQNIAIGVADATLAYTDEETNTQSVTVSRWRFMDGDATEEDSTENITAYDWLRRGCLIGEQLILFRRPFQDSMRWYFVGTIEQIIAKGTVTARSGTTPGTGTVDWYKINSSGVLTDTTVNVTAYNLATEATDSANYLMLQKIQGMWFVVFEECG